jgi:aryl-alcohol dehydrogenase-like predicted oxidoreductase
LSGKFTRPGGPGEVTRLSADSVSEREHTIARAVQGIADELAATASQVSLAWLLHRSKVHPILGVRSLDQLVDNLGAVHLSLPPEAIDCLDKVSGFDIGFPHDFIRDMQSFVFGELHNKVDNGSRQQV